MTFYPECWVTILQKKREPDAKPIIPPDIVKTTLMVGAMDVVKNCIICINRRQKATDSRLRRTAKTILPLFKSTPNEISTVK
jgi:hypothetical protein